MWRTSISRPAASPDAPSPAERRPIERILARDRLIVLVSLLAVAGLSWLWLLRAPMRHATDVWTAAYLVPAFLMWALMMVAMMLPSAAPMILLHARINRGTHAQRTRDTCLFVACYLLVWVSFSIAAAFAQATMIDEGLLTSGNLVVDDKYFAGGLLLAAGLWQLTRAKAACLEQCQSPLQFVLRYWKPGPTGALRLGVRHGLFCLGCCWSLMLIIFVGGVMNLAWIAGLAVVVFIEKIAPPLWRVDRWLAGLLISAALATVLI